MLTNRHVYTLVNQKHWTLPYNLAPAVSQFLRRDVNKGFVEVTGGLWT